jgi:ATP-dependent RNA helicase RhlE
MLDKSGTPADAIHGNKSQSARQRALENFRVGKIRALVATDLAARGIDVDGVTHVINFEIPNESESYVHRIGRTARAGASGKAISLCDDEERAYMKDIERLINKKIRVDEGQPYHSDRIANLTNTPRPAPARKGGGGHGHARGKNHPRSSNGRAGSGSSGNRSSRNSGRRR